MVLKMQWKYEIIQKERPITCICSNSLLPITSHSAYCPHHESMIKKALKAKEVQLINDWYNAFYYRSDNPRI